MSYSHQKGVVCLYCSVVVGFSFILLLQWSTAFSIWNCILHTCKISLSDNSFIGRQPTTWVSTQVIYYFPGQRDPKTYVNPRFQVALFTEGCLVFLKVLNGSDHLLPCFRVSYGYLVGDFPDEGNYCVWDRRREITPLNPIPQAILLDSADFWVPYRKS